MKKFSKQVLSPHKHMSKKASPYHAHSQGLVYTPKGKEEVRPIDTADAGYGGEAVADAQGGEANPGKASKKAVAPMKMQTLVKANEGFDSSPADIAKMLVAKHGKNVTRDHIRALEQDRDSHSGLDHEEIMQHVKKLQEETERERLQKLRSFAAKNRMTGLGKAMVEEEEINEMDKSQPAAGRDSNTPFPKPKPIKLTDRQQASAKLMTRELLNQAKKQLKKDVKEEVEQVDELKKSTLASYAKKATDDVSHHSFMAGTMSAKDPERLTQDKKAMKRQTGVIKAIDRLTKEEAEQVEEGRLRRSMRGYAVLGGYGGNTKPRYQSSVERSREINVGLDDKQERENARRAAEANKAKMNKEEAEQVDEGSKRMSAAVKLQRAFDREKAASDASRKRGEEVLAQARAEYAKKQVAKTNEGHVAIPDDLNKKLVKITQQLHKSVSAHAKQRSVIKGLLSKDKKDKESMKEENNGTEADEGEYGYEGDMAMSQLKSIIRNAKSLHDLLEPQTDLPEWVQSKITLASDYIQTAADYWRSEKEEGMNESMGDPAKEKAERILGGPVKKKSSVIGGKGQPTNLRNLTSRLATKAMKAGKPMSEEKLNMYRNMANKK